MRPEPPTANTVLNAANDTRPEDWSREVAWGQAAKALLKLHTACFEAGEEVWMRDGVSEEEAWKQIEEDLR